MTVERVRVGDVLALQRRPVAVEPDTTYTEIGVRSFGRGLFRKEPVSGADLGNKRVFEIHPGDIVISNVFAWEGATASATHEHTGTIGSHRFMSFVPTDDRLDPEWTAWFFISEPGLELIRRASPGSAGRNRTLAIDRFEDLLIPRIPIEDQRQVTARLSRIRGISREVSQRGIRQADALSAAITSLAQRPDLDVSEKIRTGWRRRQIGDFTTARNTEVEVDASATYDVAGVYSFGRGLFRRPPLQGSATRYRTLRRLQTGDLVMSRLKAWEGALAVVPEELHGCHVSQEFPAFALDYDQIDPSYLHAIVTAGPFWANLRPKGLGARRERVDAKRLLEQEILLPPRHVQEQIKARIALIDHARRLRADATVRAAALLPAALNEAFGNLN